MPCATSSPASDAGGRAEISTADPNTYRPYPEYGNGLPVSQHTHYQNYNALQALLSRVSSKFSYTAAYTWSKALGIRGSGQGQVSYPAVDIRDGAYGILAYDRTHVLNVGYSYLLPTLDGEAGLKRRTRFGSATRRERPGSSPTSG